MGYSPWSHKESDMAKNEEGGKLNFMVLSGFDEVKMKWGDYGFIFSMQVFGTLNVSWKPVSFCLKNSLSNTNVEVPLKFFFII